MLPINEPRCPGSNNGEPVSQTPDYAEMESALRVIHTWACFDGALVPEHVRDLTARALRMTVNDPGKRQAGLTAACQS